MFSSYFNISFFFLILTYKTIRIYLKNLIFKKFIIFIINFYDFKTYHMLHIYLSQIINCWHLVFNESLSCIIIQPHNIKKTAQLFRSHHIEASFVHRLRKVFDYCLAELYTFNFA